MRLRPPPRRWWQAAFVVTVVANLALLYWPWPVSSGGVPHTDKAVHLLAFAAVATTGLLARVPRGVLLGLLVVHAVTSEVLQETLLSERSGDPLDVVADLAGVALGTLVGMLAVRGQPRA